MSDSSMSDMSAMGNFKGVMLCNRPAQIPGSLQSIVGPQGNGNNGPTRPAFVSAVVPEESLGLPPVRHQRLRVAQAASTRRDHAMKLKQEDVTWRHKKWLSEFQERRASISSEMERRVTEAAERAKRFQERSQQMRDAIRGIKQQDGVDKEEKMQAIEQVLNGGNKPKYVPTEYVDVSQQYPQGAPQPQLSQQQQQFSDESYDDNSSSALSSDRPVQPAPTVSSKPRPLANKPGWARTEAEDDDYLDAEADDLLSFASNLDYRSYIDDLEVREAIKFVKDRVKGLEDSKAQAEAEEIERAKLIAAGELEEVWVIDESKPKDEKTGQPAMKKIIRRTKRQQKAPIAVPELQNGQEWNSSTNANDNSSGVDTNDLSKTVLDSNRELRNIHSSASVRAIMEKEGKAASQPQQPQQQQSATTLRRLPSLPEDGSNPPIQDASGIRPPVITTIYEREGKSNEKGPNPSNLPFLYRHPGI